MKRLLIVAVMLASGINFSPRSEGQKGSNHDDQRADNQALNAPVSTDKKDGVAYKAKAGQIEAPTSYKTPEGALVVVGIITFLVIGWQAVETRRSVIAADRGHAISKTKQRAKLLVLPDPINPVVSSIPEVKFRVTNAGESSAIISTAIAGLYIGESELPPNGSGYHFLKIGQTPLKAYEFSDETTWWAGHTLRRYSQDAVEGKEIIHLHGIITYRDAFEDGWRLRFHYIWQPFHGDIWFPHLQENLVGDWVSQTDEKEEPIDDPPKPPRWKAWSRLRAN